MIELRSITLRNFLSVGAVAQTVALDSAPLTLLLGLNVDVGGENSRNGSGKTTLLQAVCYALYGEPMTRIKVDNLVNAVNGSGLFVAIDFVRDGVAFRIERSRKPNAIRFLVSGVDQAKGNPAQTQEDIERVIGLSHSLFLQTVALNTFSPSFLRLRAAEQRDVGEELMGVTQLSVLAEHLKSEIDGTKDIIRQEEATVKANSEANAKIQTLIEQAQQRGDQWEVEQRLRIADLRRRLDDLHRIDVAAELKVFDDIDAWNAERERRQSTQESLRAIIRSLREAVGRVRLEQVRYEEAATKNSVVDEVKRLRARLRDLQDEQTDRLAQTQCERLQKQIARHRHSRTALLQRCEQIEAQLLDIIAQQEHPDACQCATCGQPLQGTEHLQSVMRSLTDTSNRLIAEYQRLESEVAAIDKDIATCETEVGYLTRQHEERAAKRAADVVALEASIAEAETRQQAIVDDILQERLRTAEEVARHEKDIADHEALLREAASMPPRPVSAYSAREALYALRQEQDKMSMQMEAECTKVNPWQDKIEGFTASLLPVNYDVLNTATEQLKHQQFLHKLLTSKDSFIRKRIMDQNVPFLNEHLNRYLRRLGTEHEGKFQPDLSVDITLNGRDFDFEQMSRGEMSRFNLAIAWAFRDLWENLNTGVNLMFVDEYFDQGMDQSGVGHGLELLKEMGLRQKNIFLVTHREELKDGADQVLMAEKVDGFTTYQTLDP